VGPIFINEAIGNLQGGSSSTNKIVSSSSSYDWKQRGQDIHIGNGNTQDVMTVNGDGPVISHGGKHPSQVGRKTFVQPYRYLEDEDYWGKLGESISTEEIPGVVNHLASSQSDLRLAGGFYVDHGRFKWYFHVSIYGWDKLKGSWQLEGDFVGFNYRPSIAMNVDGTVLAFQHDHGNVVIVQCHKTTKEWERHSTILPPVFQTVRTFSFDVDISGDGTILAVGDPLFGYPKSTGRAYVFQRENDSSTEWHRVHRIGQVQGRRHNDQLSRAVALNEQGTLRLATAAMAGGDQGLYVQLVDIADFWVFFF
jgi:hypothetical protein